MPAETPIRDFTLTGPGIGGSLGGEVELSGVVARLAGAADAPVVAVLGGISADHHLVSIVGYERRGWWDYVARAGGPIDPARCRILSIDWALVRGAPTTTADQAAVLTRALDIAGIDSIDLLVGASYGGMVALAAAAAMPARIRRLAVLSAAHESHPMATAHRIIQRRILGLAAGNGKGREALALARALAVTTYRTRHEFAERFPVESGPAAREFPVERYLDRCGERFAATWSADRYRALSESLDLHRVSPEGISVPAHLFAVREDTLVPLEQMAALRRSLAGPVTLTVIGSRYGHDAFLKEEAAVSEFLRSALGAELGDRSCPVAIDAPRPGADIGASATLAVRAGIGTDPQHGAVVPPIHLSSTYTFEGLGRKRRYDYSRTANPTRDQLADAIASLEGAAGAVVTSTGMSAVLLALQLLEPGDLVLAPHDCYGGTHRLLTALSRRGDFRLRLCDLTAPEAPTVVEAARPALVWVETPSNPLLRITDIAAVAAAGRRVRALVAVDNTFLSPALQRPLALGADIVVHSTTKYLNGHSDVVGGAVAALDPEVHAQLAWWANALGLSGAPFDAFLTLRGLRTLHARMRVHLENAGRLVALLEGHPAVAHVHYPGLASHPGHAIAGRQQTGFGAMISAELAGGVPAVERALAGLRHFSLAESLGGVESLIAHPASMTHAAMGEEARGTAGITDALVRLSVGIEDGADLEADLRAALDRAAA
ncbi:MAG TPA: cystathionine gamma-synthase [Gemmatimonadales bacterium]|nr:cystathionine gamma-synthase [Gemmatimonadales bacterium]